MKLFSVLKNRLSDLTLYCEPVTAVSLDELDGWHNKNVETMIFRDKGDVRHQERMQ